MTRFRSPGVSNTSSFVLRGEEEGGLYVPASFFGLTVGLSSSLSGYSFGRTRTHDTSAGTAGRCLMAVINPSEGVYSWEALDALMVIAQGKHLEITLGHPPDWMVTRTAVGGATAYGGKTNMVPDNLDAFCDLVRLIALRAKAAGFEGNTWDLWNEINGPAFFNDNPALLGPYTRRVVQTIRQYDPTGKILAPNTNTSHDYLATTLAISDGAGGAIRNWVDGCSMHTYHAAYTTLNAARLYRNAKIQFSNVMNAAGLPNATFHLNEGGIDKNVPYAAKTHAVRAQILAAAGASSYTAYSLGHATYDYSAGKDAWNEAYDRLAGKYIDYCAVENGTRLVLVVNGTSHTLSLT